MARLDVALGSLVWWLATLHSSGGLKLDDTCGPFQPRPFYGSMILCAARCLAQKSSPCRCVHLHLPVDVGSPPPSCLAQANFSLKDRDWNRSFCS